MVAPHKLLLVSALASACATLTACAAETDEDAEAQGEEAALSGGRQPDDATSRAVGQLMVLSPEALGGGTGAPGSTAMEICTGTLVDDRIVVTAAHCVPEGKLALFNVGPNANAPSASRGAIHIERVPAPPGASGFSPVVNDVAFLVLTQSLPNVRPIPLAEMTVGESFVGHPLTIGGYGLNDQRAYDGQLRWGAITVRSIVGAPMQDLFPNASSFVSAVNRVVPANARVSRANLEATYNRPLLVVHEVFAGGGNGDAQPCHGDSGGPLLGWLRSNGQPRVFAVTSASPAISTDPTRCGMGAVFTPVALRSVQEAFRRAQARR